MRFLVQQGAQRRVVKDYPTVVLRPDNWDDYGFKTMFHARLHLAHSEIVDLETVKIMHRGQRGGPTRLPGTSFDELLWGDFCSLGQSYSYYELLYELGESVYKPYLERLCDAAYSRKIRDAFQGTEAFRDSLLRFDGAERALEDAALMFAGGGPDLKPALLDFTYRFPRVTTTVKFAVTGRGEIPERVAAVIGYNGSGKTRLLANLARLACSARIDAQKDEFVDQVGEFVGPRPQFGSVIAVSYSAFDDFAVPAGVGNRASAQNYVYCGLRRLAQAGAPDAEAPKLKESATRSGSVTGTSSAPTRLKTFEEIGDEFHAARVRALRPDRRELLEEATRTLFREPSFTTTVELPDIADNEDSWIGPFAELSAGHKIVLNIVVALCAFVQPRSLVLIDEPELHLHPPLVAALLRAIGVTLDRYDSFAIVATHSPVVLQEVPASNVRVLRRYSEELRIEHPEAETFAENVGLLTRQVFNLDSSTTDYEGILTDLAERHTLDEIEAMFLHGLSSQGRSLVLALQQPPRRDG